MSLPQQLVLAQRELDTAKDSVKAARKRWNAVIEALVRSASAQHWECPGCGSTDAPFNQGEHNQQCARCGDRRVKIVEAK